MESEKKPIKISNKFNLAIKIIFWLLVAFFIVLVVVIFSPMEYISVSILFMAIPGVIFLLLGIALIVLTAKSVHRGLLKKFLLITGAAPISAVVSVILHNVFYGIFYSFLWCRFLG